MIQNTGLPSLGLISAVPLADLEPRSVAIVLGTRPEQIKLAVLTGLLGPAARITNTGQHYDASMINVLPRQSAGEEGDKLQIGGEHRGVQIGEATTQLTRQWKADRPHVVIVQGDTNTALAGALAANGHAIPLVHVEAGLRSHDRDMPEEHNRVLIDHLADICCAATLGNVANLRAEGVPEHRILLTGNPIVEAVSRTERDHDQARRILGNLADSAFALATIHRPENVDDSRRLASVLAGLSRIEIPVLLALHPRTRQRIHKFDLDECVRGLHVCTPPAYPAFLALMERARILISDSGGIQEEATIVRKPLIVLRKSTERPETIGIFGRLTAIPEDLHPIVAELLTVAALDYPATPTPYGDGTASQRIFEAIQSLVRPDLKLDAAI